MRERKFRAWIKDVRKFADWKQILEGCDRFSLLKDDNFILMQYTGLKDKNGVEIYEGDIVKYYGKDGKNDGYESNPVPVTWGEYYDGRDNSFHCWITIDCPLSDQYNEIEILGNIYNNPELLEKNNE